MSLQRKYDISGNGMEHQLLLQPVKMEVSSSSTINHMLTKQ